jgi:hypothetical protein
VTRTVSIENLQEPRRRSSPEPQGIRPTLDERKADYDGPHGSAIAVNTSSTTVP